MPMTASQGHSTSISPFRGKGEDPIIERRGGNVIWASALAVPITDLDGDAQIPMGELVTISGHGTHRAASQAFDQSGSDIERRSPQAPVGGRIGRALFEVGRPDGS